MAKKRKRCQKKGLPIVPFVNGFSRPSPKKCRAAVGDFEDSKSDLHNKEFFTAHEGFFDPLPPCTSQDDWLAQYAENPQTYGEYLRFICMRSGRYKPAANASKKTIYLLPVGEFHLGASGAGGNKQSQHEHKDESSKNTTGTSLHSRTFECLKSYTEAFFCGMTVEVLDPVEIYTPKDKLEQCYWKNGSQKTKLKCRYHAETGRRQLEVDSILRRLLSFRTSKAFQVSHPDTFCVMGFTMEELFEEPDDLFVAGMAAGGSKVAIFSFARYDPCYEFSPEFWYEKTKQNPAHPKKKQKHTPTATAAATAMQSEVTENTNILLKRCCKILVHEICHLFGIGHCVHYKCCMNGSGHLGEEYGLPSYLCPVDLRKLVKRIDFPVLQRYEKLLQFYKSVGFADEIEWISQRIGKLK